MARLILDTNALIHVDRHGGGAVGIDESDDVAIAAVTLAELRHGVLAADAERRPAREQFIEDVEASIEILPYTRMTAAEHAALLDLDRFGITTAELPLAPRGEWCTDSLWLPQNGPAQPFHGQIMDTTYLDESGHPLVHSVGVSLYTPVESRPENRVRFSDDEVDLAGMPRMTIDFAYSAADRALIDRAWEESARIVQLFGDFDPATERALLPPGSSLHITGTV